ncbi:unnamed protein product [Spirodela intermedia]|uniref:C2H2-type domain-containing protein n=2 Tax=Spirodela intermedia TaxID=51605 RepID=A0A7I8LL62_SPIIN|nr:unnamed protein product [Spirodela intermedia]CAA6673572.1 unnamed protein product [Spirodela intermedia]CAA7410813.1 unnamed protein product [Spirodela intermedia]
MTSKHTCKLCCRHFSSGRALGGHMRSHAKPYVITATAVGGAALPSSSSSASHGGDLQPTQPVSGDGLQEKPKRSCRLTDPELSSTALGGAAASSSVVLPDWESDTESSKPPPPPPPPQKPGELEPEPASSVSDTTPEEDVARCLVMFSRDAWCSAAAGGGVEELEMAEANPATTVRSRTGGGRRKHSCRTCGKVFRSHQALGGHRASHKQPRSCAAPPPTPPTPCPTGISGEENKSPAIIYEFSVTGDGGSGAAAASAWRMTIDLNMPPPMD